MQKPSEWIWTSSTAGRFARGTVGLALLMAGAAGGCSESESTTDPAVSDTSGTDSNDTDTATAPDSTTPDGCFALKDGTCVEETFKNPPKLEPNADGVHELELGPTEFMIDGKRHCGRSYNGVFPGPTIETPAQSDGEARQVRVNIKNKFTKDDYRSLSAQTCTCVDDMGMTCEPTHGAGHSMDMECTCTLEDGRACHFFNFNATNLHAHGSHVRPDYATGGGCVEADGLDCRACASGETDGKRECYYADDVLSRIEPGEGKQHRWDIDEDGVHHEGLQWYHPHIHGSTAIQVASGATGAWIVRGPVDELPGIKNAKERVFLISTPPVTYEPLADGQACDEDHITINGFVTLGDTAQKQTNLLNGIRQPRLVMPPGQIERWRFLHGAFLDEMTIAVFEGKDSDCKNLDFEAGPVALTQIGRDGMTMPKPADGKDWPFAPPYLFLSPGYRIDVMLDGSKFVDGDTLCMMSGRFLQADETGTTDIAVGLKEVPTVDQILQLTTNGDLIAIVNVAASAGTPTETQLPDYEEVAKHSPSMKLQGGKVDAIDLCKSAQAQKDVSLIDQVSALWMIFAVNEGIDGCGCPDHNINCRNFEYTDREKYPYDRVFKVGDVEHWRLVSGFDGHPFHIHINPYLVCPLPPANSQDPSVAGRLFEPPFAHWRDTYLVNLQRTVDLITEYRAFTGNFVYHCHKLNHEDHGMMELVRVCDPAIESCDALCDGRPCGWDQCAEGDTNCVKATTFARCFVDPASCPEAALRCKPCEGEDATCPPDAYCAADAGLDGERRCVPGCLVDTDCSPTAKCGDAGECVPAPCPGPCGPGTSCVHGACK
jgi:FtsP/CotA-like multicopper oxidase with cupredoxin domain